MHTGKAGRLGYNPAEAGGCKLPGVNVNVPTGRAFVEVESPSSPTWPSLKISRVGVISAPMASCKIVGLTGEMLYHIEQRVAGVAQGGPNFVCGTLRQEVVEAEAFVRNHKIVVATRFQKISHLAKVADEVGLMLDTVRAEDRGEFAIDDVQIATLGNIVNFWNVFCTEPSANGFFDKGCAIDDVEVFDIIAAYRRAPKRPDLKD